MPNMFSKWIDSLERSILSLLYMRWPFSSEFSHGSMVYGEWYWFSLILICWTRFVSLFLKFQTSFIVAYCNLYLKGPLLPMLYVSFIRFLFFLGFTIIFEKLFMSLMNVNKQIIWIIVAIIEVMVIKNMALI